MNNSAFTMVELLMAVGFSVLLMTGVFGFYNTASQVYSSGISGQTLQDGANLVITKILEGQTESGQVYRLATSASAYIANGSPGRLYFCQDSPCSTVDGTVRSYMADPSNTSLRYYHTTLNPLGYDVIYTAPVGTTLSLRFSFPSLSNVVEIDVALTQNLAAGITNARLATSGTASTYVLLRNHP